MCKGLAGDDARGLVRLGASVVAGRGAAGSGRSPAAKRASRVERLCRRWARWAAWGSMRRPRKPRRARKWRMVARMPSTHAARARAGWGAGPGAARVGGGASFMIRS